MSQVTRVPGWVVSGAMGFSAKGGAWLSAESLN